MHACKHDRLYYSYYLLGSQYASTLTSILRVLCTSLQGAASVKITRTYRRPSTIIIQYLIHFLNYGSTFLTNLMFLDDSIFVRSFKQQFVNKHFWGDYKNPDAFFSMPGPRTRAHACMLSAPVFDIELIISGSRRRRRRRNM